ncbi:MAG: helix-turn-helix domain-containing protein [Xanthobacteraceae bacterium]|nr:helix-turn-helix domain-containing protein [Xanthobacteraceae bacterium]
MRIDSPVLKALPDEPDTLIVTENVPLYFPIARQTLNRWRHEGRGPIYVKLGRRVAYRVSDLKAYLASAARTSTSSKGGAL